MKLLYFAILAFTALAHANGRVQGKRGVAGYTGSSAAPAYASVPSNPVTYSRGAQSALDQRSVSAAQQYVSQPAAYSTPTAQQYYQPEAQAVAYTQPAVSKYAAVPAVEKLAYVQQRRRPQAYSSAADVSSFSYTSPIVAYNNLGFLHPFSGKNPVAPQTTAASQAANVQYAAPSSYPSDSNAFDAPGAYQAVAQKAAYSRAPQAQAQAITYQSSPVNQKISYQTIPGYQGQAIQQAAPQVAYASAPSQQFAYRTPQVGYSQGYEAAAQSIPQVFYSQNSQAAAQPQYDPAISQAKFAQPGITYAQ